MIALDNIKPLYLYIGIGVILFFLAIYVYKYLYKTNKPGIEGFTTDSNSIDLLNKKRSAEVQTSSDERSTDLEFSIHPWTNKIYNLQTTDTPLKPIAFYKPHLVINGEKYCKLGDMISEHTDYTPPDNNELTLLVRKQGSDIRSPESYNLVVNFGNSNIPPIYYQYDQFITSQNNISTAINNISNCMNTLDNLTGIITSGRTLINTTLKNVIFDNLALQIGGSNPLALNILLNMPTNSSSGNLLNIGVNDTTPITLPMGVVGKLIKQNGESVDISVNPNINILQPLTPSGVLSALSGNVLFSGLTNESIQITTLPGMNIFALFMSSPASSNILVNYLVGLCNDIITILNQPNTKPEFITYLNLADSVQGVNAILSALSTLTATQNTGSNSGNSAGSGNRTMDDYSNNIVGLNGVISAYAASHSETLLGAILNIVINTKITVYYPVITFKPTDLMQTSTGIGMTVNVPVRNIQSFAVVNVQSTMIDNLNLGIGSTGPLTGSINQITNNIKPKLFGLYQFQNDLTSGNIDFYPLQIYEPIAPTGYTALGHVFCNNANDLQKIKTMDNVACVPSQCVKEIREWSNSDKVFEYNRGGVYWALYKNPYTGTFVSVNKAEAPAGKVCKVVACVAKCKVVDELIKADECARKYSNLNKSIVENTGSTAPDFANGTEEQIYLEKIKNQSDNITRLRNRAQTLQMNIDKAEVITKEMNTRKLQDYVDKQKQNIDLVAKRLEKDQNTIQVNVNIPVAVINEIIRGINNNPALTGEQKADITNKIIKNANALNSNIITQAEYNANLNRIIASCPQYDLSGLVKRATVADVCYGCGEP